MTVLSSGYGTWGVSLQYRLSFGKRVAQALGGVICPGAGNGDADPHGNPSPGHFPFQLSSEVGTFCLELLREEWGWAQEAEAVFLGGTTQTPCIHGAF